MMPSASRDLTDADYAALADFRHALREFQAFSEARAAAEGLTPQQHQALLAIRAAGAPPGIGDIAERLLLKPHSTTGLIDRLDRLGMIERFASPNDRRRALLRLTDKAHAVLAALSSAHRDQIRRMRPTLEAMLAAIG